MTLHPPNSPDLNCIEHAWAELKRRINELEEIPKGKDALFDVAQRIWDEMGNEGYFKKLVDSMPARIRTVVEVQGRATKW
jgi:hypothetical protein